MTYFIIKALHLTGAIAWIGTMFMASLFMIKSKPNDIQLIWVRRIMTVGLLVTWVAGLVIAVQGEWMSQGWMHSKLLIVVVLTGVHGFMVGRLRHVSKEQGLFWQVFPVLMIVSVFVIAVLGGAKPF